MAVRIAGYACRLPSARSVRDFQDILESGRCVVSSIPTDRFEAERFLHPDRNTRGKSVTFAAGVIDKVFDFDPGFFGISPREAIQMDPQQRLLLQVIWEALESAGLPPSSLAGRDVGVFVGASSSDYLYRFVLDPANCDTQMMTGNTLSIIANRISYQFDLRGPSLTIDTACSSSLVALSQACQAIAGGLVDTAIVAGVNLLTAPYPFVGFSFAHMLSPTGRCRAFDAAGDGYVRSEGAVALVLQSTKTAGARSLGEIAAWGANADGRTNGLSLPSSASQAALLRQVYGHFSIDPRDLAFVEAHGTGTRVGDPAEAFAIGDTLGRRRRHPLLIGSAKTNFGHLEPASGLVGVLKSALALQSGLLPASLHFETPNPDIPFADLNIEVAAAPRAFDPADTPLAGVSSFGFGGANAHVVLRAPAPCSVSARNVLRRVPLALSAQSEASLRGMAKAYRALLADEATDVDAVAHATAFEREMLDHRAVVSASTASEAIEALDAIALGRDHPSVATGHAPLRAGPVLFAFSGNGSQWAGMGRAAQRADEEFASAIAKVDACLGPMVGWSVKDALDEADLDELLAQASFAQPLLFAIQVGIVEALAARGVRPDVVVGHSVGEVAAAWAAGVLTLDDAARVIHARSRSQEMARGAGAMAAVNAPADDVAAAIAGGDFQVLELAAFNAPASVTVAGSHAALDSFLKLARARRWPFRRLDIDYPYHTSLLEPSHSSLVAKLNGLCSNRSKVRLISSVTGEDAADTILDATYWWRNVRQPVRFLDAMRAALELSPAVVLEIGPAPVLGGYMATIARDAGRRLSVIPTLRRDERENGPSPLSLAASRALASGARIEKEKFFGPRAQVNVTLPHYVWDNKTLKLSTSAEGYTDFDPRPHVLLGSAARKGETTYYNHIDTTTFGWLADHVAGGAVVVPAAAIIEIALAAARETLGHGPIELRDCAIYRALQLEPASLQETKVRVDPDERLIDLFSRRRGTEGGWIHHARAAFTLPPACAAQVCLGGREVNPAPQSMLANDELYKIAHAMLLDYGRAFQTVESVAFLDERRAHVRLAASKIAERGLLTDPTLIDGGLQAVLCLLAKRVGADKAFLPSRFDAFRLYQPGEAIVACDLSLRRANSETALVDVVYRAADGSVVAEIVGGRTIAVRLHAPERAIEIYNTVAFMADDGYPPSEPAALGPVDLCLAAPRGSPDLCDASLAAAHVGIARAIGAAPYASVAQSDSPDVQESLEFLLSRLSAAGLATRRESGVALAPVDQSAGAIGRMLQSAPERAVEATFLAAVQDLFARLLQPLPEQAFPVHVLDALVSRSQAARDLALSLDRFVGACAALWPTSRPIRVLVVGAEDHVLVRQLLGSVTPLRGSVRVVEADTTRRQVLEKTFALAPGLSTCAPEDAAAGQFDLVLAANPALSRTVVTPAWMYERLAGGGRLAIAEWQDSAFAELVRLAARSLRHAEASPYAERSGQLASVGFQEIIMQCADGAAMLAARRPVAPQAATSAKLSVDHIHFADSAAKDLAQRISAQIQKIEGNFPASDMPQIVVCLGCCTAIGDDDISWIVRRCLEIKTAIEGLEGRAGRIVVVVPGALRSLAGMPGGRAEAHAVLGFLRVCANEYPGCDVRLIDFAATTLNEETVHAIAREIVAPGSEREVLLDGVARFGLRVISTLGSLEPDDNGDRSTSRLEVPAQGSIERLLWTQVDRRPPGPDEIELEVRATGVNFRDVMWSLGALPPEALEDGFAGPTLGLECAGRVVRVGDSVTEFAPGQACVAFAPHAFSGHVTIPARAAALAPANLSFEAAATIPVAFVTVWYSLTRLAALAPGETVLVHGGAGGVGLAALQVARLRGARVIATAGQSEKRALLRDLGVDHAFDSRGQSFSDDVMAATGGRGVDVVLNSLAGEAMERSIQCLAPFGRFIELGKADFFGDTRIGLRPFSRNLSYFGVDADQLLTGRPELAQTLFTEISGLVRDGALKPLPYNVFEGEDVTDALRLMQRSQHVGKIVVRPLRKLALKRRLEGLRLRADSAYVVAGGLGGFGLALARRLWLRGAGRIVLLGRSPPSPDAAAAIAELRAGGADIVVRAVDATDTAALTAIFSELDAAGRSPRGLFHCAMTLDDRLIENLDADGIAGVLRTKIAIAQNLDRLSRGRDIDFFVLFSSATTLVGNPGQANYVAANAYLEEMARLRRRERLPATAIAWGPISDVGYLTGDDQLAKLAALKLGRHAIGVEAALDWLERLLRTDDGKADLAAVGVGRFDFSALRRDLALLATPLFARIATSPNPTSVEANDPTLALTLAKLSTSEARLQVTELLVSEIARIMRAPADQIDTAKPLAELGVDSLMGVELRLSAEERLGIDLPLLTIGGAGSIVDLAERCVKQIMSLNDSGNAKKDDERDQERLASSTDRERIP